MARWAVAAGARIAVVRALPGVGDMLCAVPALRALRRAAPDSEITLVGLEQAGWFPGRYPAYVDGLLACRVWPGLTEIDGPRRATAAFRAAARRRRFDVAIQMHGDGRASNGLAAALGATRWVGLAAEGIAPVDERGTVGPYCTDRHEIDRCCDALALLGVTVEDPTLEFPVTPEESVNAARLVPEGTFFAAVHPGASRPATRWSPIGFARVADHLLSSVDMVVLTGAPGERPVTGAVHAAATRRNRVVDLGGATSLGSLAALMRRAAVVVANDTGAAHLAAAVGAPVVTVCGPSDRVRWAPRGCTVRVVGGEPFGRWPSIRQVNTTIDLLVGAAARSGS